MQCEGIESKRQKWCREETPAKSASTYFVWMEVRNSGDTLKWHSKGISNLESFSQQLRQNWTERSEFILGTCIDIDGRERVV